MPDAQQSTWNKVDEYFAGLFVESDAALAGALKSSEDAGLPAIAVSPNQGKLLHLLARIGNVRRVLEIGTLGGYSTIWLARALPSGGALVTLELNAKHAEVARTNFRNAGLDDIITLREGAALESLQQLAREDTSGFDFIFIDADKPNVPLYFSWALKLARVGAIIVVDNVVREGEIINETSSDASVVGVRQFNDMVAREPRVTATALQTVGTKGYDGFVVMLVTAPEVSVP